MRESESTGLRYQARAVLRSGEVAGLLELLLGEQLVEPVEVDEHVAHLDGHGAQSLAQVVGAGLGPDPLRPHLHLHLHPHHAALRTHPPEGHLALAQLEALGPQFLLGMGPLTSRCWISSRELKGSRAASPLDRIVGLSSDSHLPSSPCGFWLNRCLDSSESIPTIIKLYIPFHQVPLTPVRTPATATACPEEGREGGGSRAALALGYFDVVGLGLGEGLILKQILQNSWDRTATAPKQQLLLTYLRSCPLSPAYRRK